ncbi:sulfolipid-1 biosynthesis transporter Sap [soil metagenome]
MLIMGMAVIFEPVRLALVVLMLNRPQRPMVKLFAFVLVGFVASVCLGLVVVLVLKATPLANARRLTIADVHLGIGAFALIMAVLVATNLPGRVLARRTPVGAGVKDGDGVAVLGPTAPEGKPKLSAQARHLLRGDSVWVAASMGLFNLPSYNYTAALAVILASGASTSMQIQALLLFNVVAFAVVGSPLITYLVAPHKTRVLTAKLHTWLRTRRRRDVVAMVAAVGCLFLALGASGV